LGDDYDDAAAADGSDDDYDGDGTMPVTTTHRNAH